MYRTAFQSKELFDRFCSCGCDLDPITLILDFEQDILKMCLHIMRFLNQGFLKLNWAQTVQRDRRTDRQTRRNGWQKFACCVSSFSTSKITTGLVTVPVNQSDNKLASHQCSYFRCMVWRFTWRNQFLARDAFVRTNRRAFAMIARLSICLRWVCIVIIRCILARI